jgi:NAD(P)-dependent dehydrogenase (short-subunit alcohol dehydrogenase family)
MTTHTAFNVTQSELDLLGQTVLVIGGSVGIGLETARLARAEGADVILTARNPSRLERAAAELGARRTAVFDACPELGLRTRPSSGEYVAKLNS